MRKLFTYSLLVALSFLSVACRANDRFNLTSTSADNETTQVLKIGGRALAAAGFVFDPEKHLVKVYDVEYEGEAVWKVVYLRKRENDFIDNREPITLEDGRVLIPAPPPPFELGSETYAYISKRTGEVLKIGFSP